LKEQNEKLTKLSIPKADMEQFRNTMYVMKGDSWAVKNDNHSDLELDLRDGIVADAKCLAGMILLEALLNEVPGYQTSKDDSVLVHGPASTKPSADLTSNGYDQHYQAHLIIFDKWVEGQEGEKGYGWVYPVIIIVNPDGSVNTVFGKPMRERLIEWELAAYEDMLRDRDEWDITDDD
jgi:hypothetical protein